MTNIIWILLILAIFIAWAEAMYYFAGKDRAIPFGIIMGLGTISMLIPIMIGLFASSSVALILVSAVLLFFILFWGATLYEQAGNNERSWYYLTLIIPLLAVVYQIVNKN